MTVKNITKLAILVGLLLQVCGHPVEEEEVGWDWCVEGGHPFIFMGYKFGWPIPIIHIGEIWGCLSTPHRDMSVDPGGLIGTALFWLVVIKIFETYWPVEEVIAK